MNTTEVAAALLRQVRMVGRFDWLGGYTHALLMDDGETLGAECVAPNYRQISHSTRHEANDGWQVLTVVALDDPDANEHCSHCGKALT